MESFIFARILAGLFAGLVTSIALAIVIDQVPVAQRARAMAIVMGPLQLRLSLAFLLA